MDDQRKCFTFIWKIKNFSFSFNYLSYFDSPVFFVHEMSRSMWNLELYPKSTWFKDCLVCRLRKFDGPAELELDYELSLLTSDGSVLLSEIVLKKAFELPVDVNSGLKAKRDDVLAHKKDLFIPDDTITIRCRMWKTQGSISESVSCYVETRIGIECRSLVGAIENFSSLMTNSKNMVCIKSSEKEFPLSSMNLCINVDGKLDIEIKPIDYVTSAVYKVQVFITDAYRNKVKSSHREIFDRQPFCVPLTFSWKRLIENKERYLPNDVLTLQCEVIFPKGLKVSEQLEKIDDMAYDYDSEDIQAAITYSTNSSFEEQHTKSLTTLTDDLISLFNEGILYDTKLKTATETFPAHTVVLSARSPVFKSMFVTDMREKKNKCVDIEDLNADTIRQMILFMYKDTLNNLDYESAKSLYFAADKYNIVSLKQKCSIFLKQNLLYSNCCDILLLADKHQDLELKKSVQDCIAENDKAVFSSDEWKNLEDNHPRLTIEILRSLYMKNKKT